MPEYCVVWQTHLDADDPQDAAMRAWQKVLDYYNQGKPVTTNVHDPILIEIIVRPA